MEFLTSALQAVPQAATHPFSFIAYLAVVLAWFGIAYRIKRTETLLANIEKLDPGDRLIALQSEIGGSAVAGGISPDDWLQQKRQSYYFLAFLALVGAAIVVFVIAFNQSNLSRSRQELVDILGDRSSAILASFDTLLEVDIPDPPTEEKYEEQFKKQLANLKAETVDLVAKQREALLEGNLVRTHEIGNQINTLADKVGFLLTSSDQKSEVLLRLQAQLNAMLPGGAEQMRGLETMEEARRVELKSLANDLILYCKSPVC